jgi:acetyltransferase-like isoleucine patch superfamily enzyme
MTVKIHSLCDVQSKAIGEGTTIWQYCVILPGAIIGKDCNVCSHCFIENDVKIGDRVTIKNGVCIFDSIELEDGVFVGPNVTFTNDLHPRSQREKERRVLTFPFTKICKYASIGGDATILPGVTIGEKAMIGAGAVVINDVEPGALVIGSTGKFKRHVDDL